MHTLTKFTIISTFGRTASLKAISVLFFISKFMKHSAAVLQWLTKGGTSKINEDDSFAIETSSVSNCRCDSCRQCFHALIYTCMFCSIVLPAAFFFSKSLISFISSLISDKCRLPFRFGLFLVTSLRVLHLKQSGLREKLFAPHFLQSQSSGRLLLL